MMMMMTLFKDNVGIRHSSYLCLQKLKKNLVQPLNTFYTLLASTYCDSV